MRSDALLLFAAGVSIGTAINEVLPGPWDHGAMAVLWTVVLVLLVRSLRREQP